MGGTVSRFPPQCPLSSSASQTHSRTRTSHGCSRTSDEFPLWALISPVSVEQGAHSLRFSQKRCRFALEFAACLAVRLQRVCSPSHRFACRAGLVSTRLADLSFYPQNTLDSHTGQSDSPHPFCAILEPQARGRPNTHEHDSRDMRPLRGLRPARCGRERPFHGPPVRVP